MSLIGNDNRNRGKLFDRGGQLSARTYDKDKKVPRLQLEILAKSSKHDIESLNYASKTRTADQVSIKRMKKVERNKPESIVE